MLFKFGYYKFFSERLHFFRKIDKTKPPPCETMLFLHTRSLFLYFKFLWPDISHFNRNCQLPQFFSHLVKLYFLFAEWFQRIDVIISEIFVLLPWYSGIPSFLGRQKIETEFIPLPIVGWRNGSATFHRFCDGWMRRTGKFLSRIQILEFLILLSRSVTNPELGLGGVRVVGYYLKNFIEGGKSLISPKILPFLMKITSAFLDPPLVVD